eukprot:TRINITY_DN2005_c1_g1_i1.p1 TRINITY_DN2005_c1_g1~~TRINITY_DN2005_c1_g1_i1.p1  ORF type:complete len:497 (-),score=122.30 TRINITY_DN2005_c1_g1_i1:217-1659(-)
MEDADDEAGKQARNLYYKLLKQNTSGSTAVLSLAGMVHNDRLQGADEYYFIYRSTAISVLDHNRNDLPKYAAIDSGKWVRNGNRRRKNNTNLVGLKYLWESGKFRIEKTFWFLDDGVLNALKNSYEAFTIQPRDFMIISYRKEKPPRGVITRAVHVDSVQDTMNCGMMLLNTPSLHQMWLSTPLSQSLTTPQTLNSQGSDAPPPPLMLTSSTGSASAAQAAAAAATAAAVASRQESDSSHGSASTIDYPTTATTTTTAATTGTSRSTSAPSTAAATGTCDKSDAQQREESAQQQQQNVYSREHQQHQQAPSPRHIFPIAVGHELAIPLACPGAKCPRRYQIVRVDPPCSSVFMYQLCSMTGSLHVQCWGSGSAAYNTTTTTTSTTADSTDADSESDPMSERRLVVTVRIVDLESAEVMVTRDVFSVAFELLVECNDGELASPKKRAKVDAAEPPQQYEEQLLSQQDDEPSSQETWAPPAL